MSGRKFSHPRVISTKKNSEISLLENKAILNN